MWRSVAPGSQAIPPGPRESRTLAYLAGLKLDHDTAVASCPGSQLQAATTADKLSPEFRNKPIAPCVFGFAVIHRTRCRNVRLRRVTAPPKYGGSCVVGSRTGRQPESAASLASLASLSVLFTRALRFSNITLVCSMSRREEHPTGTHFTAWRHYPRPSWLRLSTCSSGRERLRGTPPSIP